MLDNKSKHNSLHRKTLSNTGINQDYIKLIENNEPQKMDTIKEEQVIDHVYKYVYAHEIGTDFTFKRKIVWFNAIGFLILHLIGIVGVMIMIFGYTDIRTTLYFIPLTVLSGLGITMGAHRLFAHRTYKAKTWLKVFLIILQTMTGQNCLYVWVRDHRQHHKYSDTDADPHNATRGFFFSHIGWLMSRKHPKVIEYGKKIDMSDLEADPWIMFQKRYYKTVYFLINVLIPTSIPIIFWNESLLLSSLTTFFARTVLQLNFTWSVNSIAHIFGNKPYDKNILPTQSSFVAIVAAGEGWHNFHHAFPWDYRASEMDVPYNLTTTIIDKLAKYGAIYDRKFVPDEILKKRILRTGDGTHPLATSNMMPHEITENEAFASLDKYVIDKKSMENSILTHLERQKAIEDLNNNMNKKNFKLMKINHIKDKRREIISN